MYITMADKILSEDSGWIYYIRTSGWSEPLNLNSLLTLSERDALVLHVSKKMSDLKESGLFDTMKHVHEHIQKYQRYYDKSWDRHWKTRIEHLLQDIFPILHTTPCNNYFLSVWYCTAFVCGPIFCGPRSDHDSVCQLQRCVSECNDYGSRYTHWQVWCEQLVFHSTAMGGYSTL